MAMSQLLVFKQAIDEIKIDNTSGSASLLTYFVYALNELLSSDVEPGLQIQAIEESVISLGQTRQEFPVIAHFIAILQPQLVKKTNFSHLKQRIADYNQQWADVNKRIAANATDIIDWDAKTIMVHSNSSTVVEFFKTIVSRPQLPAIIQTESRPNFEGRIQGNLLTQMGFDVTIIVDAAMGHYTNQVDLAIVGADAVADNFFYNKMGTYLLALTCNASKKPFYVLTDSRKKISGRGSPEQPKPTKELYNDPPTGIKLENFYFEATPNELVSQFIFE